MKTVLGIMLHSEADQNVSLLLIVDITLVQQSESPQYWASRQFDL